MTPKERAGQALTGFVLTMAPNEADIQASVEKAIAEAEQAAAEKGSGEERAWIAYQVRLMISRVSEDRAAILKELLHALARRAEMSQSGQESATNCHGIKPIK